MEGEVCLPRRPGQGSPTSYPPGRRQVMSWDVKTGMRPNAALSSTTGRSYTSRSSR